MAFVYNTGQFDYCDRLWQCIAFDCRFVRRKRQTRIIIPIALCTIIAFFVLYPVIQNKCIISKRKGATLGRVNDYSVGAARNKTDKRRLPQVLIIGTRKSGTRALLRFLEINPAIRSAHREVHFFDRDANYRLGIEWYRNQMPETRSHEITIEKSPAYFVTREAPDRIKSMNASIKLVVILRNPVTRLISDFSQTIANRIEGPPSSDYYYDHDYSKPEHAKSGSSSVVNNSSNIWIEAEDELRSHVLRPDGGIDDQRRIVRIGMYSSHLERWFSVFPRDQFHFVNGEKLIEKPHEELRKLERFIGLSPPVIVEEHFGFSPKKGFYCLTNQTALVDGRSRSQTHGESVPELLCLGQSKGRRHVAVGQDLLDKLRNFYTPYNEYLEYMTGLNFNV